MNDLYTHKRNKMLMDAIKKWYKILPKQDLEELAVELDQVLKQRE